MLESGVSHAYHAYIVGLLYDLVELEVLNLVTQVVLVQNFNCTGLPVLSCCNFPRKGELEILLGIY